MVRGIEKFKEFFAGYEDNYVIIGGTACEVHEEIYAQNPRATKDIDIILIVEALSSDFVAKFWEFVKVAGYVSRNKGTGEGEQRHEYYRFKEPSAPEFPYQVELFSRNPGLVNFPESSSTNYHSGYSFNVCLLPLYFTVTPFAFKSNGWAMQTGRSDGWRKKKS